MSKTIKTLYNHYVDISHNSKRVLKVERKLCDVLFQLPEKEQKQLNIIINEYYDKVQYQGYKAGLLDGINLGMNTRR